MFQVHTNDDLVSLDEEDSPDQVPTLPPPKMAISLKSKDVLETTMTKTCLEVLGNLGKVNFVFEHSCNSAQEHFIHRMYSTLNTK